MDDHDYRYPKMATQVFVCKNEEVAKSFFLMKDEPKPKLKHDPTENTTTLFMEEEVVRGVPEYKFSEKQPFYD